MYNHPVQPYTVSEWGSHPDLGNDDCWTSHPFMCEKEARAFFDAGSQDTSTSHLMIEGPTFVEVRKNPGHKPYRDNGEWRREMAMEAGMLGGCNAYNEMMRFD